MENTISEDVYISKVSTTCVGSGYLHHHFTGTLEINTITPEVESDHYYPISNSLFRAFQSPKEQYHTEEDLPGWY